jgi:Na+/H+ antiporter NhaD/arsenite permease-like protein
MHSNVDRCLEEALVVIDFMYIYILYFFLYSFFPKRLVNLLAQKTTSSPHATNKRLAMRTQIEIIVYSTLLIFLVGDES